MSNYAIVHIGTEHRRCRVVKYGDPLLRYGKNQVLLVVHPDDEQAAINRTDNFCVVSKNDWESGDNLSCICGTCGEDLTVDSHDSEDEVSYLPCLVCNC